MRRSAFIYTIVLAAMLAAAAAPDMAWARAGGGQSSGSRGSRTYSPSPSTAAPIQRSTTPQPSPQPQAQPGYQSRPGYTPAPAYAAPVGHPFLRGIAGGLVGASIAHMLFGGSAMAGGEGYGGVGGGHIGLLHILLVGLLIWLAVRFFRNRMAGGMAMPGFLQQRQAGYGDSQPFVGQPLQPVTRPLVLQDSDHAAFTQAFVDIQAAWSARDFDKLRQLMTPEMVQYFNEELSTNISRGEANHVENVVIDRIDQVESWQENNLAYATVMMKWHANDYMARLDRQPRDPDYVSSGSLTIAEPAQEQWTFIRAAGGRWLLSAIQQVQ